jgi:hypothetical protein
MAAGLLSAAIASVLSASAEAQSKPTSVDLVLVLAVDSSGSITDERWTLEQQGYSEAFRNPDVLKAIRSGPNGAVAVTVVEWSTKGEERQVVPWAVVHDQASADAFSAGLAELPRAFRQLTSIREGILFSAQLLSTAPFEAARKVIDVSGDGPDNTTSFASAGSPEDAAALRAARDQVVAQGVTINGLPIVGDPRVMNLDQYYLDNVIGGPESFMIVAGSFDAFARAVERKLVEEIAAAAPSPEPGLAIAAGEILETPISSLQTLRGNE